MRDNKKIIFIKVFSVVIAVLLLLPCSAKREIKQILDLPISDLSSKVNKTAACTTTFKADHKRSVTTCLRKKNAENFLNAFVFFNWKHSAIGYSTLPFSKNGYTASSIPIYTLYQQYLI